MAVFNFTKFIRFTLTITTGLALAVIASANPAVCEKPLLSKSVVAALHSQGVTLADLRFRALRPLPLAVIKARFDTAIAAGQTDVDLSEFRDEALWMRARLPALKVNAVSATQDPRFLAEVTDYEGHPIDFGRYLESLNRRFEFLRTELAALSRDSFFSYKKWYLLAREFAELATLASAETSIMNRWLLLHAGLQRRLENFYTSANTQGTVRASFEGSWRVIPTVRHTDIAALDEWMSFGLSPVWTSDHNQVFDDNELSDASAIRIFKHDDAELGHPVFYPAYPSGSGPRRFFESFRRRLQNDPATASDPLFAATIEAAWAFFFHEKIWFPFTPPSYGPEVLLEEAPSDSLSFEIFLKPATVSAAMRDQAIQWLVIFARQYQN